MVQEAEKYEAEDEAATSHISAKNTLESYSYASKFESNDKSKLEIALNKVITWLDSLQEALKEIHDQAERIGSCYEVYLSSLFSFFWMLIIPSPIMQRLYGSAGGAPGGFPGAGSKDGPLVKKVD